MGAVLRFSGAWSEGSTHRSGGRAAKSANKLGGSLSVMAKEQANRGGCNQSEMHGKCRCRLLERPRALAFTDGDALLRLIACGERVRMRDKLRASGSNKLSCSSGDAWDTVLPELCRMKLVPIRTGVEVN